MRGAKTSRLVLRDRLEESRTTQEIPCPFEDLGVIEGALAPLLLQIGSRRGRHTLGDVAILRLLSKVLPYPGLNETSGRQGREEGRERHGRGCVSIFSLFL